MTERSVCNFKMTGQRRVIGKEDQVERCEGMREESRVLTDLYVKER